MPSSRSKKMICPSRTGLVGLIATASSLRAPPLRSDKKAFGIMWGAEGAEAPDRERRARARGSLTDGACTAHCVLSRT